VYVDGVRGVPLPPGAEPPIEGEGGHPPVSRAGEGHGESIPPSGGGVIIPRGGGGGGGGGDGGDHDRGGPVRRQPSGVLHLHGHIVARRRRELMLLHGDIGPWGVPDSVALPVPPDLELTRRILSVRRGRCERKYGGRVSAGGRPAEVRVRRRVRRRRRGRR